MSDNKKPTRKKQNRTLEKKRCVKNSVFSIHLIDELIEEEQDEKKLTKLRILRKEASKVWQ